MDKETIELKSKLIEEYILEISEEPLFPIGYKSSPIIAKPDPATETPYDIIVIRLSPNVVKIFSDYGFVPLNNKKYKELMNEGFPDTLNVNLVDVVFYSRRIVEVVFHSFLENKTLIKQFITKDERGCFLLYSKVIRENIAFAKTKFVPSFYFLDKRSRDMFVFGDLVIREQIYALINIFRILTGVNIEADDDFTIRNKTRVHIAELLFWEQFIDSLPQLILDFMKKANYIYRNGNAEYNQLAYDMEQLAISLSNKIEVAKYSEDIHFTKEQVEISLNCYLARTYLERTVAFESVKFDQIVGACTDVLFNSFEYLEIYNSLDLIDAISFIDERHKNSLYRFKESDITYLDWQIAETIKAIESKEYIKENSNSISPFFDFRKWIPV